MYKIFGRYQGVEEELDSFDTRKEAEAMANEYRTAFGAGWTIWVAEGKN